MAPLAWALLQLLFVVLVNCGDDHQEQCSRSRSRTARRILEEYLEPFVESAKYELPADCRLHPANDVFREQDSEREFHHIHQWRCGYCEKMFESESYLDLHLDNRHSDMVNVTRQNCLADLCGALHCDYMETKDKHKYSRGKCSPSVDRNRHLCEKLANSCFPPQTSATALRLNDFFLRQFCDAHTCKPKRAYFPRGSGKPGNEALYYAACFFSALILLVFYGGLYIYKRDTEISISTLKRLSQRSFKGKKSTKNH